MTQATHDDLLAQLPHGEEFRFVDRIVSIDPGRAGQGVWDVTGDESFFAGHFPGNPIVPGVLIGEALAQMAGLVGMSHSEAENHTGGQLAQIDLRLKRPVMPPAQIKLQATFVRNVRFMTHFDVVARCKEKIVAKGSVTIATVMKETP